MNSPALTATITGQAAADAELSRTYTGTQVARARVPHTPWHRRNPASGQWEETAEASWVTVTVWGSRAPEFAAAVRKDTPLTATGLPRISIWTDAEGVTQSELAIDALTWGVIPTQTASATPAGGRNA